MVVMKITNKKRGFVQLVNLTLKKVYCPKCQKLSRVKLQKVNSKNQFFCVRCNQLVWQQESLGWKYTRLD